MNKKFLMIMLVVFVVIGAAIAVMFFAKPINESQDKVLQKYTKGYIELTYLGDSSTYSSVTNISKSEAEKIYKDSIDMEIQYFNEYFELKNLKDEEYNELNELIIKVYKMIKYDVSLAREIDEYTYEVDVKIKPINIVKIVEDELIKKLESVSQNEFKNINDNWNQSIINILKENIDKISYFEEETVVVTVEMNKNGVFEFSQDSLNNIDAKVVSYEFNE